MSLATAPQDPDHQRASPERPYFSGSYRPGDVRFLLTPIEIDPVDIDEKERLIQSGTRHYSEMLSRESLPSPRYLEIFHAAFGMTRGRMAEGLLDLAAIIASRREGPVTLVSLARAGTPIGVVLKHALELAFGRQVAHYSVSIIRDRGIDETALRFILGAEGRAPASLFFIDGWTGKGVIARELRLAVTDFNRRTGTRLSPDLYALTDLAGVGIAPSDADYLIPSGIMNATMSGLISRSILNERIGRDDFHGCVYYSDFEPHDLSIWLVEELLRDIRDRLDAGYVPRAVPVDPAAARAASKRLLADIGTGFGIRDENLIKPGIGEATRVLLRRSPELLMVRDPQSPEVGHLLQLAQEKQVRWETRPDLPYQAVSLIKGVLDA